MHIQVAKVCILASASVPFLPTMVQMPNLAQIEMKWIIQFKKSFLQNSVANSGSEKLIGQIESGRYRGLNADVQAEAQERGKAGGGVHTVQILSFNYLDNTYFALTYTL
jgi:hypothetical protein